MPWSCVWVSVFSLVIFNLPTVRYSDVWNFRVNFCHVVLFVYIFWMWFHLACKYICRLVAVAVVHTVSICCLSCSEFSKFPKVIQEYMLRNWRTLRQVYLFFFCNFMDVWTTLNWYIIMLFSLFHMNKYWNRTVKSVINTYFLFPLIHIA